MNVNAWSWRRQIGAGWLLVCLLVGCLLWVHRLDVPAPTPWSVVMHADRIMPCAPPAFSVETSPPGPIVSRAFVEPPEPEAVTAAAAWAADAAVDPARLAGALRDADGVRVIETAVTAEAARVRAERYLMREQAARVRDRKIADGLTEPWNGGRPPRTAPGQQAFTRVGKTPGGVPFSFHVLVGPEDDPLYAAAWRRVQDACDEERAARSAAVRRLLETDR